MKNTDRAVQATRPGLLEVVEREVTAPGPGKVRIQVEACGVCHSDILTVEGGRSRYPIPCAFPVMKSSAKSMPSVRASRIGKSVSESASAFSAAIAVTAGPADAATS